MRSNSAKLISVVVVVPMTVIIRPPPPFTPPLGACGTNHRRTERLQNIVQQDLNSRKQFAVDGFGLAARSRRRVVIDPGMPGIRVDYPHLRGPVRQILRHLGFQMPRGVVFRDNFENHQRGAFIIAIAGLLGMGQADVGLKPRPGIAGKQVAHLHIYLAQIDVGLGLPCQIERRIQPPEKLVTDLHVRTLRGRHPDQFSFQKFDVVGSLVDALEFPEAHQRSRRRRTHDSHNTPPTPFTPLTGSRLSRPLRLPGSSARSPTSRSRKACAARLNFLRLRCTIPTGRTRSGAFSLTATIRPWAISACMVRAGRMLMPRPSPTASLIMRMLSKCITVLTSMP